MSIRVMRKSTAAWNGTPDNGSGRIVLGSGAFEGPYSLRSRVADAPQTNPEELIGAGHAGCFAMSLASLLADEGHPATEVNATAKVTLEEVGGGSFSITQIALDVQGVVEGIDETRFVELAEQAKATCPVSRALAGTQITLNASLAAGVC